MNISNLLTNKGEKKMPTLNIADPEYFNPFLKNLEENTFNNYHLKFKYLWVLSFQRCSSPKSKRPRFTEHITVSH